MKLGFLYAGQGSQHAGMGADLYEAFSAFRAVYDHAEVDFDLKKVTFEDPDGIINQTRYTQPCMVAFAAGVTLADGQTMQPAQLIPDEADPFAATVVLRQGVYHQIKRMFGVLDAGVNQLHRTAIGGLALDEGLAPGAWRLITPEEKALIQAGGEG